MWKYVLKKLLLAVPVLLGITIIDYAIMCLAGSPLDMMVGPRVTEGAIAARAAQWGLDQPVWVQYWNWLREVLHGNLGFAYKSGQPVSEIIGTHLGPTLLLMGVSMALGLLLAVPAGIYSAVHRYQKRDYAVVSASFLASSVPGFFLSLVLVYVFFLILTKGGIFSPSNFTELINQNAYVYILGAGMLMCMLTGGNIDLSCGAFVCLLGAFGGVFMVVQGLSAGVSILLLLLIGVLYGVVLGYLIAYVHIPPWIATLAGYLAFRGLGTSILRNNSVTGSIAPFPQTFLNIYDRFGPLAAQ